MSLPILTHLCAFLVGVIAAPVLIWAFTRILLCDAVSDDVLDDAYDPYG